MEIDGEKNGNPWFFFSYGNVVKAIKNQNKLYNYIWFNNYSIQQPISEVSICPTNNK